MKPTPCHALALAAATLLLLSGCSTTSLKSAPSPRSPAAAADPLIEKFVDALAERSGLGSEEAVEDAVTQVINDNASKLNLSKIDSLDDIAAMSDADQSRIVGELASLPELSEKLSLDSQAVDVARGEAIASQDVEAPSTEAVPDLQRGGATRAAESAPTFSAVLRNAPEMESDVQLMLKENTDIQQKTGASVLGKDCGSLENPDSVENMATIITGVDRDVEAGQATDTPTVAKSLQNNMEYVLGTDDAETHERILRSFGFRPLRGFLPEDV